MAKGFSARVARKAVNQVFQSLTYALWCGELVEIPGGTIQSKIRQGSVRFNRLDFRNVNSKQSIVRWVWYRGWRRVVTFKPDLKLDLPSVQSATATQKSEAQLSTRKHIEKPAPGPKPDLNPSPLEKTAQEKEAQHLASELLGIPATREIMAVLLQPVALHADGVSALLRRLNHLKNQGYFFGQDVEALRNLISYFDCI